MLSILGSSSAGNGYLFKADDGEALVIEAGVKLAALKKEIGYNVNRIAGVIVTHSHHDHAGQLGYYLREGIDAYLSAETANEAGCSSHHNTHIIKAGKSFFVGGYHVLPFEVVHDVACFGFLIHHPESGRFVFITDTHYSPFRFKGLNNIIIEANYSQSILENRLENIEIDRSYYDRVMRSHMSLETTMGFLKANELAQVNNIVLIHLSDGNSNAKQFKADITAITAKQVHIAETGKQIPFNNKPF
jgi:phosphoribosyl 1,2-cyclic phosphodiesterase